MRLIKQFITAAFALICSLSASANDAEKAMQDSTLSRGAVERPVISAFTLGAGSTSLTETYLSPLKYSGWRVSPAYERMQAMRFNPSRWVMRLHGAFALECTANPAGNANIWGVDLQAGWQMLWRQPIDKRWLVGVGGSTDLSIGALYSTRNGNNPVQAKAAWTVGAAAYATLNTRIGRMPITVRYIVDMPLCGVFFAPEYGELYYEIGLGNHKGLAHAAWPGNYFCLRNYLSVDLRLNRTIIRLGYRFDLASAEANHIVSNRMTHLFVLGFASEWVSLSAKGNKHLNNARIISALY